VGAGVMAVSVEFSLGDCALTVTRYPSPRRNRPSEGEAKSGSFMDMCMCGYVCWWGEWSRSYGVELDVSRAEKQNWENRKNNCAELCLHG